MYHLTTLHNSELHQGKLVNLACSLKAAHGPRTTMKEVGNIRVHIVSSHTPMSPIKAAPCNFWEVIQGWGNTWLWDNLVISGDTSWITKAITDNSCVTVTDGYYMKEVYPNVNSLAFVFKCSKGRGRLMGTFVEVTPNTGSYRGELLSLMAIHLILHGVQEASPGLTGSVHILSDCLGALYKVENLPPYQIPTQYSHSDILKNIMVNCSKLSFKRISPTSRPIKTTALSTAASHVMPSSTAKWIIMQKKQCEKQLRNQSHPPGDSHSSRSVSSWARTSSHQTREKS
jgi:hypothetical protein